MLVMHEPMNTSSTRRPATSDRGRTSSGSLGQATSGSVMAEVSISMTAAYSAPASARRSDGSASHRSMAWARRSRERASSYPASIKRSQHHHVGAEVGRHRVLGQGDGAAGRRPFGGGVGELERLLHGQVLEPFDLDDPPAEHVLAAWRAHGELALPACGVGDGLDQVPQRDAGLDGAAEADEHRFGHVQGHGPGGRGEGHQPRAGGEGDAQREAGVGVASGADLVREEHPVQPAVDDAVPGPEGDAAPVGHEPGERPLGLDVDGLRVGRRVAEASAGPGRHRSRGSRAPRARSGSSARWCPGCRRSRRWARSRSRALTPSTPHARPTIFWASVYDGPPAGAGRPAGTPGWGPGRVRALALSVSVRPTTSRTRPPARTPSRRLLRSVRELGEQVAGRATRCDRRGVAATMWSPVASPLTSHSMGRAPASSRVLAKIGAILRSDHHPALALVGHEGDVVADVPQQRVHRALPRRSGADDVAHEGHRPPAPASARRSARSASSTSARLASSERAWSGMSARDQASVAGERSSVLISPSTLNTVRWTASGTGGRPVNQSAAAHDRRTASGVPIPAPRPSRPHRGRSRRPAGCGRVPQPPPPPGADRRAARPGSGRCSRPAWCRGARTASAGPDAGRTPSPRATAAR